MTCMAVPCPPCPSEQVLTRGNTARGTPRALCQHTVWVKGRVLLASRTRGCWPEGTHTIMALRRTARGIRDTARGLRLRTDTGRSALTKPAGALASVHSARLRPIHPEELPGAMERAGAAAREERGSCVGTKGAQRWLWPAMDHPTGAVVASVCGRRNDAVLLRRTALREPCGLTRLETAPGRADPRPLAPAGPRPGTRHPQKIARTPLPVRRRSTRVVRQTLCCSQTTPRHDIVLGVFVNRYACGLRVYNGHLHF